jgi:hypothetical protein
MQGGKEKPKKSFLGSLQGGKLKKPPTKKKVQRAAADREEENDQCVGRFSLLEPETGG